MNITLFGANNPSGAYFLEISKDFDCTTWGRKLHNGRCPENHIFCDLTSDFNDNVQSLEGIIVSFAPIWLLAKFLSSLYVNKRENMGRIKGIVACSSSSYLTKRFAFCKEDQELAVKIVKSHDMIMHIARGLDLPCKILAPSLVYGVLNGYSDKNISRLIHACRLMPIILVPKLCGERQPIHAGQLAECALHEVRMIQNNKSLSNDISVYCVGGDEILDYAEMLKRIQVVLPLYDRGRKCMIVTVPDWFFYLIVSLLLPTKPKLAEALCRIKSNLSGFRKVHTITGTEAKTFPVVPLAT